ncbi:hypothetical protein KKC62_03420 [Patescibacteria group bacterium]|nr:hypothetical protein [Patescibacteria group bacterium]MBU1953226.1 hypothetical protein [Patescibacteria group bacterium]
MAKKLLVSFTGLLYALKSGRVTTSDLDDALFCFGCTKDHALYPGRHGEGNEVEMAFSDNPKKGEETHKTIVSALKKAQKEGRVAFRTLAQGNASYELLNKLLKKNGFPVIDLSKMDWANRTSYNYPTVQEQVEAQGIGLEVIWRG